MHKPLSKAEVEALNSAVPVMTRVQKLERWAQIVEKSTTVEITQGLEFNPHLELAQWPNSPMALAAADPVFQDAGLTGGTVGDARKFFELSDNQVHAFSCGCHGNLSPTQIANRIRTVAAGGFGQ